MMKNRFPFQSVQNKTDFFYNETKVMFGKLMRLIVEEETKVEIWRHKFNSMPKFSIRGIFDRMDILRRNYLAKEDVTCLS